MNSSLSNLTQEVVLFAETIQQIASPTFHEQARAQFIFDEFMKMGLENVCRDAIGNVLGKISGGNSSPLVLSAHLDSVFPFETPLTLQKTDSSYTGPGIGDNALGLASLLGLAQTILSAKNGMPGDLWFIANVREEGLGNLNGMSHVITRFADKPVAYIVIEGIGLGFIQNQALGIHRLRIAVKTTGGHSWVDYGKSSSIHEINKIAADLLKIDLPLSPRTTLNIGKIYGGDSINTIAPSAEMEIDLRSEDQNALRHLLKRIEQKTMHYQNDEVQITISNIGTRPSGCIAEDHKLIQTCKTALRELGITPFIATSSTDASLPISLGYPATCLAITSGSNIHSVYETIDLAPIPTGLTQILNVIMHVWD